MAHKDDSTARASSCPDESYDAVVVGAGFSGIYMLHRLRELNLSARVFEAGGGVGGTWYWNRYPGARVDGHSLQYSYSFSPELEQDWHWPEMYSAQPDLERYLNHVADRFDLRRDIQLNTTVMSATYDEDAQRWIVRTDRDQRVACRFLITAVGNLSAANVPTIKGLDSYGGAWHHTAHWPHDGVDFTGLRVGIIGTGSTGIQAVPVIAEQAEHLFVFQRTAHYSLPSMNAPMDADYEAEWKRDYPAHREAQRKSKGGNDTTWITFPDRSVFSVSDEERERTFEQAWGQHLALMGTFNDLMTDLEANAFAAEFARRKIRSIVKDPEVAETLCPKDYPIGGKRICINTDYYETFNRDNVTLVDVKTNPIEEITPTGLQTTAASYEFEVLVFATGFDAITGPLLRLNIAGCGGLTLSEKWQAGPRTYLGVQTAGYPNLFMITGPGSPSVLSTMTTSIEQHVDWIADALHYMATHRLMTMEPTVEAENRWVEHVNEVASTTILRLADNWYLGANIPGKPRIFMPYAGGVGTYREKCEAVVASGYEGFVFGEERGA